MIIKKRIHVAYQLPPGSRWRSMYFWDPVRGCTPISDGCKNCSSARTIGGNLVDKNFHFNGVLEFNRDALNHKFSNAAQVFVCGRSDLFHEKVPFQFVDEVLSRIQARPDCQFFMITKRANRMAEYFGGSEVPKNLWVSVTTENQKYADLRIPHLAKINGIRILSIKPMLGSINFRQACWVVRCRHSRR